MKKRRNLLVSLGVILTLSVATPAMAAQPAATAGTQESTAQTQDGEAEVQDTENDGADSISKAEDAQDVTEWVSEETEQGTRWKLKYGLFSDGNPYYAQYGAYSYKGKVYRIDADEYMVTGYLNIEKDKVPPQAADTIDHKYLAAGLYYFEKEGDDPSKDDLGNMLTNCWAPEADENGVWHYLGEDGRAIPTSEKTGWQQPGEDWIYLNEEGTVDTTKEGWVQIGDAWMLASKGVAKVQSAGWYQIDNKWYALKDDGTRDTSKVNWQQINGKWYYLKEDGTRDTSRTGMQTGVNGKTYFLDADGVAQSGFQTVNGVAYYFDVQAGTAKQMGNNWQKLNGSWYWIENGKVATGWRNIKGKWYYLNPSDGKMLTGFFKDNKGQLYYSDGNGAMLNKAGWNKINGTWYWLNGNGSIKTGWLSTGGRWYYLSDNGAMKTGWYQVKGVWYFSDTNGAMKTGWLKRGNTWYYLTGSGAMATGWLNLGGTWYYLNPSNGAMRTGWYQVKGVWYYSNASGKMATGWLKLPSGWYYLKPSGAMATGWINLSGTWYYLNPSNGAMYGAGWHKINNKWYYMAGNGAMYTNRWIGNYYVGGSGAMLTSTWVGSYWVGADGKWIPNYNPDDNAKWVKEGDNWYYQRTDGSRLTNTWKRINGSWYYFGGDSAMVTGWRRIGSFKYYFNSDGKMSQDVDSLIGKQSSYKLTVNRVKCQVMVYAKSETGNYDIPVKTFTCSVGKASTPTHAGTWKTLQHHKVVELMGPSWGKYGVQINNYGDWFHSVACSNPDPTYSLAAANYNMLGQPASHGCVRLCVRDAKWIHDNCKDGTTVVVSDTEATPFDKAPTIKIPAGQNWDPTDTDAKR